MDRALLTSDVEAKLFIFLKDFPAAWIARLRALQAFFAGLAEVVRQEERLFAQASDLKESSEQCPAPASMQVVFSWRSQQLSTCSRFVKAFSEDYEPRLTALTQRALAETAKVEAILKAAHNATNPAEHAISRSLRHLDGDSSGKYDPWLETLALKHHCAALCRVKEESQEGLRRAAGLLRALNTEMCLSSEIIIRDIFKSYRELRASEAESIERLVLHERAAAGLGNLLADPEQHTTSNWPEILNAFKLSESDISASSLVTCDELYKRLRPSSGPPAALLKCGFLSKSSSRLLSRTWLPCFCILDRNSSFFHFYSMKQEPKPSTSTGSRTSGPSPTVPDGHLIVPQAGKSYEMAAIADLNALAQQFFFAPHHPAGISALLLTPSVTLQVASATASNLETCTFTLKTRSGDKLTLKAFCEEDLVDWVTAINGRGIESSPSIEIRHCDRLDESASLRVQPVRFADPENETNTSVQSLSQPFSPQAPIVELDNPWE